MPRRPKRRRAPADGCDSWRQLESGPDHDAEEEVQAAELRGRLASFAEEWDSPEMTLYDNYDVSKNELQTR
jgi:hypothetical protein